MDGLRKLAADMACRAQEDSAALSAAAREKREAGQLDLACRLQHAAAERHAVAFGALEWMLDEPFLREWCENINRGRVP